jgi:hypothetical protein
MSRVTQLISITNKLMLDESTGKFPAPLAWSAKAHKVINAHGESTIGLKRKSEPKEAFFPSNGRITHTNTFARKSRALRGHIASQLQCNF